MDTLQFMSLLSYQLLAVAFIAVISNIRAKTWHLFTSFKDLTFLKLEKVLTIVSNNCHTLLFVIQALLYICMPNWDIGHYWHTLEIFV